jgi:hypothetical protein
VAPTPARSTSPTPICGWAATSTQADVGTINRSGGTVKLNGFLENSWPDAGHHRRARRSTACSMAGGTIQRRAPSSATPPPTCLPPTPVSGTLDGVTLHGNLDVTGAGMRPRPSPTA